MPVAKPTTSTDTADIQRRMAQIRHDMHQEVQGAVEGAQSLTDWRTLVKSHPWLSLSVASVVGYLIVPRRRHPVSPTFVTVGHPSQELLAASATREQQKPPRFTGWSILGTAFSLLAPVAVRAAQNFALGHLDQWLSQYPSPAVPGEPPGDPTRESGGPASMGPAARLRKYGS